jgi:hypothetical protein
MYMQYDKEMREIMKGMDCPDGFSCYKNGFKNICRAKNFGVESVIECLEDNPQECKFAHPYGHLYFCRCPMRNYVEQKLGTETGSAKRRSG